MDRDRVLDEAVNIVVRLAQGPEPVYAGEMYGDYWCALCGAGEEIPSGKVIHEATCPWQMAVWICLEAFPSQIASAP